MRARLRQQDFYTLITFARRIALSSIRTGDGGDGGGGLVASAYDALSAIELDRVDWRDVSWAAAIVGYAAQRLGRPAAALAAGSASRAHPDTAALLASAAGEQIDLAGDWGLREFDLGDGPVFLGSDDEAYAPDADLAGMAIALADAFEADLYTGADVTVASDIPAVWLHGYQPDGVMGCAKASADRSDSSAPPMLRDMLLAFVIQTQTSAQTAAIAAAANAGGMTSATVLTATSDRLGILLIARSVVQGRPAVEDHASLMRFEPRLRALVTS